MMLIRPLIPYPGKECLLRGIWKIFPLLSLSTSLNPDVMENIHIGANCSPEEIAIYMALFKEFRYVFAWSYEEMPGIDPSIVEHEI